MKKKKFSILGHELIPEHIILLNEEEVKDLLKSYEIKKEQLPKIKSSDPVIKGIGAKEGAVIKVIRRSKIAGKSLSYRLVVE